MSNTPPPQFDTSKYSKLAVAKYRQRRKAAGSNRESIVPLATGGLADDADDADDGWAKNGDEIVLENLRSAKAFRFDDWNKSADLVDAAIEDEMEAVQAIYLDNNLHIDAALGRLQNFTIVHLSSYFGALRCLKWALAQGGSTVVVNNAGRNACWYANMNKSMESKIQKELGLTYLSRMPAVKNGVTMEALEGPFNRLSMQNNLRRRFEELQTYQSLHLDKDPIPPALAEEFFAAIAKDDDVQFDKLLTENNIDINAPIMNPSKICRRTYLLHEVYKVGPYNKRILGYYTTRYNIFNVDPVRPTSEMKKRETKQAGPKVILNLVDGHGREASWYSSLEYLELAVLAQS